MNDPGDRRDALREDLDALRAAVAEMRHAQRDYFRTKRPAALRRSKAAEKTVDDLLHRLQTPAMF